MGITSFDIEKLNWIIETYKPKSVIEAGAQNLYNQPLLPAPYADEYYNSKGMSYACIDLSGENGCLLWDLSKPREVLGQYDLVSNFGTNEHIGKYGKFDWEATYNAFHTEHKLLKVGGIAFHENPMTGHWEKHGFTFYTEEFYRGLIKYADYEIIELGEVCAMGNCETGKNIYAILHKTGERFPSLEEFKTLDIRTS